MSENRCVMCGEIITEGIQVCPACEDNAVRDVRRTKDMLRIYRDMEWKAKNAKSIIRECNDMMTAMSGFSSSTPVQGGSNTREGMIIACIDRKSRAEYAVSFMRTMNAAIKHLTADEREVIMSFYVDRCGIRWICRNFHVGRTKAYEICNSALRHLDRLLF